MRKQEEVQRVKIGEMPVTITVSLGGRPSLPELPECRECSRPANREHFATAETKRTELFITYLYCDYCEVGFETLWVREAIGGHWRMDSSIRYSGKHLAAFMRILEAQSCVD